MRELIRGSDDGMDKARVRDLVDGTLRDDQAEPRIGEAYQLLQMEIALDEVRRG